MTKTEYIKKMYTILSAMCVQKGYYNVAAGMIAQSIQEGWNSELARKYFNYWGMKGESKDWKGPKVAMCAVLCAVVCGRNLSCHLIMSNIKRLCG